jgi:phosphonopyruvate decarboxylase
MISCGELFNIFHINDLTFFTGVPDSTFKSWMSFLENEHGKKLTQIIAANECEAVGIAAGYHLSTGKTGVVYLQNSGQGKTVNPITSLCDPEVYSIPMILMIGWRGEPGKKDEPQHKKMGRVMIPLLETLEIPYRFLPSNFDDAEKVIAEIKAIATKNKTSVALIVKKGIISSDNSNQHSDRDSNHLEMNREDALKTIIDELTGLEIIVSTTGKTSRELFEYRIERKEKPRDFYTVGGMGCAASIALGIALQKSEKEVFVFDGDGAVLMQMGSLATIGHYKPANFNHILFDNEAHDSTGGQTTVSGSVNFEKIALACGYKNVISVEHKKELIQAIKKRDLFNGPNMIIVNVSKGARKNLGRPTATPLENKEKFMRFIEGK